MGAPQFTVNAQRFDPYKNFKFRIKWDGKYVAGMSKTSALKRSTEVVTHREGGDPSTSRVAVSSVRAEPSFIGFAMAAISKRKRKSPEHMDNGQLPLFAA